MVSLVTDLGEACQAAEAMGFAMTPRGRHPIFATNNHLAVFKHDYWELLAVEEKSDANAYLVDLTARRAGLAGFALATSDIEVDINRLRQRGVTVQDPVKFARPVETRGKQSLAKFKTARLADAGLLNGFIFLCEHSTPELVWGGHIKPHNNGVHSIQGITLISSAPELHAGKLSALIGSCSPDTRVSLGECDLVVDTGPHWLRLVTSRRFLELYPGVTLEEEEGGLTPAAITFRTTNAATCSEFMQEHGLQPVHQETRCYVQIDALGDTTFEFCSERPA